MKSTLRLNLRPLFFALLVAPVLSTASAATVSCPDLSKATQVATCPAEEELKYTFTGYCSDSNQAYRGETDVCTDYTLYRKLKNVALWESGDGAFSAYVSCDLPADKVKDTKASAIKIRKQGKMTHVVCSYGDDVNFTYRTRAACAVKASNCTTDSAACEASCD
jgi:hypothetical protein